MKNKYVELCSLEAVDFFDKLGELTDEELFSYRHSMNWNIDIFLDANKSEKWQERQAIIYTHVYQPILKQKLNRFRERIGIDNWNDLVRKERLT